MYFLVGCTEEKEQDKSIILKSLLYDSAIRLTDEKIRNEYFSLKKNGCESLKTDFEKELNKQGMLLNQDEVKAAAATLQAHFDNILMLTIMPTESCNFRCVYCYETHEEKVMKEDTVEGIIKFLQKNHKNYNHISISWFGGEPTLCKKIVLRINETIKRLVDDDKSKYTFTMTTNGYLLDENTFLEYYNSGIISYQITIDGWKQDENRPLKNGQPTLEKIIQNLDSIHKLPDSYKFSIMIRNNILADNRDFSWYDFLDEKYGEDERFGILIRQVSDLGGTEVEQLNLLSEEEGKRLIKEHTDYINRLHIRCDNNGIDKNVEIGRGMCYAAYKNGFSIRADGKIEKCTVALDTPENEIGYLDQEGNMHLDERKNQMWSGQEINEKCYSCNSVFSCLNKMCPLKSALNKSYLCKNHQSFF